VRNIGRSNSVEVIDVHVGMSGHPEWFCDEVHPNAIGASNMASVIYTSISPKK